MSSIIPNKKKPKVVDNDVPKLQIPIKKGKITPKLPIPKLDTVNQETHIDIPRSLTPVNNQRLKFSTDVSNITTPKTNEWYQKTFREEINNYNDLIDHPPPPPNTISPKPYKQPIKKQKRVPNPNFKPNFNNKPGRKVPSKKHEFRGYSNSWGDRSNKGKNVKENF